MLHNLPALHPKLTPPSVDFTEHKGSTYMLELPTHELKGFHDVSDKVVEVSIFFFVSTYRVRKIL
jgi:hypothetical protein